MICICPDCQVDRVHVDKGIFSYCQCPVCFSKCDICMGQNRMLSRDEIRAGHKAEELYHQRLEEDGEGSDF